MNNVPEAVLQECLDLMEHGESIEQILARYPELAGELRPFLQTAVQLANLASQPALAAKQKSRKAFLAHAENLKVTPIQPSPWYRLRQILLPLASLGIVLFLFITTAVSVSASAIPGDALYPVKRLVENIRLTQSDDPETAVALREQYRQERIREVQALLRTGRSAAVTFEGEVEDIQTEAWTVAGIKVTLDLETTMVGEAQVGELARVNGRTADGVLVATIIEMLTGSPTMPEPVETPTPTQTPSPSPTATATEEATAEPTDEPTLEPTPTGTATPTASPTATITPSPSPTPTLMPPDPANDNDDEDDEDDNQNDGDSNDNDSNSNDDEGNENDSNSNDDDNANNDNDDSNANNSNDDDNANNDNDDSNDNNDNEDDSNDNNDNGVDD